MPGRARASKPGPSFFIVSGASIRPGRS
jgi:hypothetical protein